MENVKTKSIRARDSPSEDSAEIFNRDLQFIKLRLDFRNIVNQSYGYLRLSFSSSLVCPQSFPSVFKSQVLEYFGT